MPPKTPHPDSTTPPSSITWLAPRWATHPGWVAWLGLGLVMSVLFYLQLGSYPLFDVDEPRYAEAAREMLARGNWITPYFNDVVRFDKPVMFYWLIAGSYKLFGINEFAARLVSAIAATGTVGLTAWAASRWGSPRWGLMAGLMLASCLEVTGLARMSVTDMTLTLWLTGCSWCLLGAVLETPRWWVLAGVFSGMALLTKGPVGLVLPGAIVLIYSLLVGRFKATFANGWFALGTLLAVAIAAPWYMAAGAENGMAFWNALVFHNVDRFSTVVSGHKQFPFFYPVVLIAGFLPWSIYLPATLAQWLPQLKTFWQGLRHQQQPVTTELTAYLALYCLVWAIGVYGFFEVSQTKLLTYILPMFPAIAVLVSGAFWQQATHPITHPKAASALSTSGVLLWLGLLLGGVFFINNMSQFMPREAREISGGFENVGAVLILLTGTGLSVLAILNRRWMGAIWAQSIAMAALVTFTLYNIVPNVSQVAQGAMLRYAELAQSAPLVTYGIVRPSLTFYARQRIAAFDLEARDQLWAHLAQQVVQAQKQHTSEKVYVVTKARLAGKLTRSMPTGWHMQVAESPAESGGVYTLLKLTYQPGHPTSQAQPFATLTAPHPKP